MIQVLPIAGLPLIRAGDDLADMIASRARFEPGDVLVVAQKVVSKSEGRAVRLQDVEPGPQAHALAQATDKDPRVVELILQESHEVLRAGPGVLVVEDRRGFVAANAGIDRSNVEQEDGETVLLLPSDPDESARMLMDRLRALTGLHIPVIINDSHGRAWREGTVGVAIGVAGLPAVWDRRGEVDLTGYALQHTIIGIADELASAASLEMGPGSEAQPAVIVRGAVLPRGEGSARQLQRLRERDLFR